jgi:UDP:flavonoid glycosyltransferase YjiC (YdhE family)
MSVLLLCPYPMHGHVNPMVPLAAEGLSLGLPMVLVPQALDQRLIARRIVELGAGVVLDTAGDAASFLRTITAAAADVLAELSRDAVLH